VAADGMPDEEGKGDHPKVATVVGLGGSLAPRSGSLSALRIALAGAEEAGAATELLDLRTLDLPMYRPDAEPTPVVERFCDLTHSADGLLWSSPLYHGTVSGSFKNALDWLQLLAKRDPPYLTDKVIGLIAAAGGVQGLQAVNTMEFVVRALRGWAVPLVVPVAQAWRAFDDDGGVTDTAVEAQLRTLGREVASVCLHRRSHSGRT
jgi:FMN reductase